MTGEQLAKLFHETYERLAPKHGYQTREASAKPWEEVPEQNKALMIETCDYILGVITGGKGITHEQPDLKELLERARPRHEVGHDGKDTDVFRLWLFLQNLTSETQRLRGPLITLEPISWKQIKSEYELD
ncbi:MAG: hypothetical protein M3P51_02405 [Chloroflexota bacterium]|nr:hypothetical protein [Chloroflexota bacterium]